jgi:signal transduction histidine kinase
MVLGLSGLAAALLLHQVVSLSERRAAFVSAVTHELRTPLTTFRLYSEMLAEGMVSDESQRSTYLDTLRREAERLSHLVENVLQYAQLERGVARNRYQQLPIPQLLDHALPALQRRAELAGMRVVVETSPEAADLRVHTDPEIVEQILFNLVDNACKYAATAGDPRIHLGIRAENAGRVQLRISDHGPGISAKQARRLFRPFRKTAEEAAESSPGVGLGLSLCRRLAQQIGGRLNWIPGNGGACFVLTLPRASGEVPTQKDTE